MKNLAGISFIPDIAKSKKIRYDDVIEKLVMEAQCG